MIKNRWSPSWTPLLTLLGVADCWNVYYNIWVALCKYVLHFVWQSVTTRQLICEYNQPLMNPEVRSSLGVDLQSDWSYSSGWIRRLVRSPGPVKSGSLGPASPRGPLPPGNDNWEILFPPSSFAAIPPSPHTADARPGCYDARPLQDRMKGKRRDRRLIVKQRNSFNKVNHTILLSKQQENKKQLRRHWESTDLHVIFSSWKVEQKSLNVKKSEKENNLTDSTQNCMGFDLVSQRDGRTDGQNNYLMN